ncbi:MAG TPA: c-type cytochrome [Bacteroidota bacterium]|nr:c-type cytochrome [Bacteroidota bacterium]
MKRIIQVAVAALVVAAVVGFRGKTVNSTPNVAMQDAQQFNQDQEVKDLRDRIAGKEDLPASEVFKNIQVMKSVKAGRIPDIMVNYSKDLGQNCLHCHAIEGYDKETNPKKQVARDMFAMVGAINSKEIAKIKNLSSKDPGIGCWTCHRGQVKPERSIPAGK